METQKPFVSFYHQKLINKEIFKDACAQAVKAREIHKANFSHLQAARGTINGIIAGCFCWGVIILAIIGVVAVVAVTR